jgi:hypothetical protein
MLQASGQLLGNDDRNAHVDLIDNVCGVLTVRACGPGPSLVLRVTRARCLSLCVGVCVCPPLSLSVSLSLCVCIRVEAWLCFTLR